MKDRQQETEVGSDDILALLQMPPGVEPSTWKNGVLLLGMMLMVPLTNTLHQGFVTLVFEPGSAEIFQQRSL